MKRVNWNALVKASDMRKAVIAGLLLTTVVSFNYAGKKEKELKYYYDNKGVIELADSQVVCVSDRDCLYLKPSVKYYFDYDENNRVIEKKAMKWDAAKDGWVHSYCLRYTYEDDTVIIAFALWNRQRGDYNDCTGRLIYTVEKNTLTSSSYYTRALSGGEWNLEYAHFVNVSENTMWNDEQHVVARF